MKISKQELIDLLLEIRGATFVTFTARTQADAKKNPWGEIWKTATVNGLLNFYYEEGVRRRLEKEGKDPEIFKQGGSWHEPVILNGYLTPLCRHKKEHDRLYLRFMVVRRLGDPTYADPAGNPLDVADVAEFLRSKPAYQNQGLEDPLEFLVYGLDSIQTITIGGVNYELAQDMKEVA